MRRAMTHIYACVHMHLYTRVGEENMEHYLEYEEEFGKCVSYQCIMTSACLAAIASTYG